MIMTPTAVDAAARRLLAAMHSGVPCQPVRDLIGRNDVGAAYAIQQRLTRARLASGAQIVGRKIGLTSPAVQQQLGVDRPDFGVLFADMDYSSAPLPLGRLIQPKAEAEVAFVLGDDLVDGELGRDQVHAAIAGSYAALEIVDSRIINWDISYADTVADNGSAGLYVLGDRLPDDVEPRTVTMEMLINGEVVSTGDGAACLGDPVDALVWLAATAREYGEPLRAGQIVLSGALGPMAPIGVGDVVSARLKHGDAVIASVTTEFAQERA